MDGQQGNMNQQAQVQQNEQLPSQQYQLQQEQQQKQGQASHSELARKRGAEIPPNFICPITQQIMENPVVAMDGHTYEVSP